MSDNYFLDNIDLQFRLEQLKLQEVLEIKEKGYHYIETSYGSFSVMVIVHLSEA